MPLRDWKPALSSFTIQVRGQNAPAVVNQCLHKIQDILY